jgi:hypothetical protein
VLAAYFADSETFDAIPVSFATTTVRAIFLAAPENFNKFEKFYQFQVSHTIKLFIILNCPTQYNPEKT